MGNPALHRQDQQVGASARLLYAGMGDCVVVAPGAMPVVDALSAILPHWPQGDSTQAPGRIRVDGEPDHYRIHSPWLDIPQQAESATAAACALFIEMTRSWLYARPGMLCLHCAAFEHDGRLIVLAGTNRSGKSTLAAALGAAGAKIYCDDMLPLTPDGLGLALGIPPRLRLPLPDAIAGSLAGQAAGTLVSADRRYGYAMPSRLAPHGETAPLGGIVLLDRVADGPTSFHAVARSEALAHLLLRNLHRDISSADAIARLLAVASDVPTIRMTYSDIDAAVDRLMALTPGQWPAQDHPDAPDWAGDTIPLAMVDATAAYRHAEGVHTIEVDGDLFATHPQTEEIFRLNPVAAILWELFEEPTARADIVAMLEEAFPGEPTERLAADADRLMAALLARDLLRPAGG